MAEVKTEVVSWRVDYTCDFCNAGTMQATGLQSPAMIPGDPIKYQHKCSKCNDTASLVNVYPYVAYTNKDGE